MRRRNKLKLLGTQTLMNFYRARKKEKIFLYQIIISISLVNIVISSPLKFNQKNNIHIESKISAIMSLQDTHMYEHNLIIFYFY